MNVKMKMILVAASLPLALGLTGCTDEQVAETLGDIALAAIIIATPPPTVTCIGAEVTRCHEFRDFFGVIHTECHQEFDPCAVRRVDSLAMDELKGTGLELTQISQPKASVTATAEAFAMSFDGSQKLLDALQSARNKDLKPMLALGLSRNDIQKLAKMELPSDSGIQALAQGLNQDVSATRAMVQKLIDITVEQRRQAQLQSLG